MRVLFAVFAGLACVGTCIAEEEMVSPAGASGLPSSLNPRPILDRVGRAELVLVDGAGRTVGNVLDIPAGTGTALVPVTVNGIGVVLEFYILNPDSSITGAYSGVNTQSCLYFASSDCSGPPLIKADDIILPNAAVAPPGRTLYVSRPGSTRQEFVAGSIGCSSSCEPNTIGAVVATEAIPVARLDQLIPPPYRVVVRGIRSNYE